NWSQLTFVTSTVTWAWADREAARAKTATKAMKTCFRAIRSSSQEIAIFAKRPIGCTDSVNRLESLLGWLVATAEEDGLNIRRNSHTSAAVSDCRTIAIYEY